MLSDLKDVLSNSDSISAEKSNSASFERTNICCSNHQRKVKTKIEDLMKFNKIKLRSELRCRFEWIRTGDKTLAPVKTMIDVAWDILCRWNTKISKDHLENFLSTTHKIHTPNIEDKCFKNLTILQPQCCSKSNFINLFLSFVETNDPYIFLAPL
jgi:hypothetical protein